MRTNSLLFLIFLTLIAAPPLRAENPTIPNPPPKPAKFPRVENPEPTPVAPVPSDGWADGVTPSEPPPPVPFVAPQRSRIFAFQANGLFYLQAGGGNSLTGQFSWTPQFKIDRYEMRLDLGVALPKNSQSDLFIAFNYELMFRTKFNNELRIDVGGGAMTFTGTRGVTRPVVSGQLCRFYENQSPVNQIFLGYSLFFAPIHIHIFKAGIGFTL